MASEQLNLTTFLYYACGSEPYLTLDPSVENSNGVCVLQNVYETLTRYNDQTGEVEPYLATSWTHNDDGTVWEFTLREDVSFHDGTKMNANAVKKSIDRTIKLGKGAAYIWTNVESVEVVSDYVSVVVLPPLCPHPAKSEATRITASISTKLFFIVSS